MPLSTIIIDDEQLARDELAYLLKSVDEVEVVAQGKNGLEIDLRRVTWRRAKPVSAWLGGGTRS